MGRNKRNCVEGKRVSQVMSHCVELKIKQGIVECYDDDAEATHAESNN